jgi:predicted 3-demethylubiquinone-9 3-methyltransferase (glyoxalase superfamily)
MEKKTIASQKIHPFLWFNNNAEDAAKFYISVFKNSSIKAVSYYGDAVANATGVAKGTVLVVAFEIEGQAFTALNGGPQFQINPAISFVVNCDNQDEIDYYWEKLSAGGATQQCGWLTDKFGVSWQIVPTILGTLMSNASSSEKAMQAMLTMSKFDIAALEKAANS